MARDIEQYEKGISDIRKGKSKISFINCGLDSDDIAQIVMAFEKPSPYFLQHFVLIGDPLDRELMRLVVSVLRNALRLTSLEMSACAIDAESMKILAPALRHHAEISRINLSNNQIDGLALSYLASKLSHLAFLEVLDLSVNHIDALALHHISLLFQSFLDVRALNLCDNPIEVDGVSQLSSALLKKIFSLECIDVGECVESVLIKTKANYHNEKAALKSLISPSVKLLNYSTVIRHCIAALYVSPGLHYAKSKFKKIVKKSHASILPEFYQMLSSPALMSLASIEAMFSRLVHVADLKFPCALAIIAKRSGEFVDEGLNMMIVDAFWRIAERHIYTRGCVSTFIMALDSVEVQGVISRDTKQALIASLENVGLFADEVYESFAWLVKEMSQSMQLTWLEVQQELADFMEGGFTMQRLDWSATTVKSHVQGLKDRMNESAQYLLSIRDVMRRGGVEDTQLQKRVCVVNAVLALIPLLALLRSGEVSQLMPIYGAITDLNDVRDIGAAFLEMGEPVMDALEARTGAYIVRNKTKILSSVNIPMKRVRGSVMSSDQIVMAWARIYITAHSIENGHDKSLRMREAADQDSSDCSHSLAGPSAPY